MKLLLSTVCGCLHLLKSYRCFSELQILVADLLFSFPDLDYYCLSLLLFSRHLKKTKKPKTKKNNTKNPTRTQIQTPIIRSAFDFILTGFFSLYHISYSL